VQPASSSRLTSQDACGPRWARVVRWPAPPQADGVYAVKVAPVTPVEAAAAERALARRGLRVAPGAGAAVLEGHPWAFEADGAPDLPDRDPAGEILHAARRALGAFRRPPQALRLCGRVLDLRRPRIVGVLNATPDSFYDQGRYYERSVAVARAEEMVAEGADMIEVGGETARPGPPVDEAEEIRRVAPLLEALAARLPVPLSVDTYKPAVARRAVAAGAVLINDISGLADPRLAELAAQSGAGLVIMHILGRPKVRQLNPRYAALVDDVYLFLARRAAAARAAGVAADRLVIDPGLSFGKTAHQDVELLRRFGEFQSLGYPLYLATSRKNYIRDVLGLPFQDVLEGTAAAVAYGVAQGARLIRTHDVRFMARLVRMTAIILDGQAGAQDVAR
jgi:dihydropteroate synthase